MRHQRADVGGALAHQRGGAAHDRAALQRRRVAPQLEAALRGGQRAVQVGDAGMGDAADLLAGGRVQHGQRLAAGGIAPLAVDEESGVGVAHGSSRGVEAARSLTPNAGDAIPRYCGFALRGKRRHAQGLCHRHRVHALRQARGQVLPGPGPLGLCRPAARLRARRAWRAADRAGLVRQLRHGPVGAGRHPRPGGLHAAGRGRPVPRARADDQCRRRLRHRVLRLPRRLEGRARRARPRSAWRSAWKSWSAATTRERTAAIFATGIDQLDRQKWLDYYAAAGAQAGKPFETGPGRTRVHGHLCDAGRLAHAGLRHDAAADRRRRVEEPPPRQPEPEGAVPVRSQRGRGAGRPRDQLPADARDVLAAGRRRGRRAAVLGRRAGELPARGAVARGAGPHQPACPAASTASSTSRACRASPPTRPMRRPG